MHRWTLIPLDFSIIPITKISRQVIIQSPHNIKSIKRLRLSTNMKVGWYNITSKTKISSNLQESAQNSITQCVMDEKWKELTDILSREDESSMLKFNNDYYTHLNVIKDTVLRFTLSHSPPSAFFSYSFIASPDAWDREMKTGYNLFALLVILPLR